MTSSSQKAEISSHLNNGVLNKGLKNVITLMQRQLGTEIQNSVPKENLTTVLIKLSKQLLLQNQNQHNQINSLTEKLKKNQGELEMFLYQVSHDLKQPLITVHGYIGVLRDILNQKPEAKEWIDGAMGAVIKMDSMIDVLLELSRIGRITTTPEEINLEELILEVFQSQQALTEKLDATLIFKDPLPIIIEERSLIQLLFNCLLSNSLKSSNSDSSKIIIQIKSVETENTLTLSLEDNGQGISPEYKDKVYDIFYSINKREDNNITGSGLTIAKKIIEHLKGKIWFESVLGKGTVFYIQLPLKNNSLPI